MILLFFNKKMVVKIRVTNFCLLINYFIKFLIINIKYFIRSDGTEVWIFESRNDDKI